MHEKEAMFLIKPVLDDFIDKKFENATTVERELFALCIADFIADREPYWVMKKAQRVVFHLLHFSEEILASSGNLKDATLSVLDIVKQQLAEYVEEDINALSKKGEFDGYLRIDIAIPQWNKMSWWRQASWKSPKRPPI
ncbi:MAG: hypothetical protein LBT01_06055 [Spirochaetaceae bacterium]|jgi:hypothetical protein|nr:hypothetical protein [Spirochaetaceae bacterium]